MSLKDQIAGDIKKAMIAKETSGKTKTALEEDS